MTEAAPHARPTALVYGSCVARDTVASAEDRGEVQLVGYVARQSLVSVGRDARHHLPASLQVASPFQERMIRADFSGSLDSVLTRQGPLADAILWDLADERHGLHRFPDDTIVTRSIDNMVVPELAELLDGADHIKFGSAEHRSLWGPRAVALANRLRAWGLFDRVVVIDVPWAETTSNGEAAPASMGLRSADANKLYRPYYATLRSLGFRMVTLPQSAAIADVAHRWGAAPFHYVPDVYRAVLDAIPELNRSGPDVDATRH